MAFTELLVKYSAGIPLPYIAGAVALILFYAIPYLSDNLRLNGYPGPVLARFSHFWSLYWSRKHQLSYTIYDLHKKHGDFVRLSPDHVSVAHPDSIRDVLGHGNGFLKSDFYYAFDNIEHNIFTTRDRSAHGRKRKYVAHMFSPKAMVQFEPYITNALGTLGRQMESLIDTGRAGDYVALNVVDAEVLARTKKGEAGIDAVMWSAFLAFDIIGDLAFGEPFGFTARGWDSKGGIKKLRDRGEWSATVGQMPWIKTWTPYFFFDSFFTTGLRAARGLATIGIAAVEKRKAADVDPNRKDILYYLLRAKDPDTGGELPDSEVKAEALTQLIAGSDTTGNTITHLIDMLLRHPEKYRKLQAELDNAYPAPLPGDHVAMFVDCKDLPYTQAVIYETLRLRTTVSLGLPSVVPEGGATVCGRHFKAGTVLSTPTYTTHRDPRVWGPDSLEFKPERWLGDKSGELEASFLGFSYGPRACIGRNVAFMELKKTVATIFRRFEYRHVYPEKDSYIREGFHLKCQELLVFVSRRK
ncbi:putative Cytochrome P450 benzoate 4-monooxygenase [Pleurostoma richardsiae]|uniref:Cytochrome P450 benzoate 4-monooxygenase n=1 Tax=Pleurostoma richardsiae TaxID=41990 RepID=A0AA38VN83_9PEZI|nr:putative Cytochrome P450 benzoate 4-monooxygenase [Pleurostoma richardsiae]